MILSILVGAVLGTRYKVLCLVPTTLIGLTALAGVSLYAQADLGWTMLTALGLVVWLQIGYLFGITVRMAIVAARVRVAAPKSLREQQARIR